MTQKTLSAFRSDGRGLFRFRTATCCRRARISVWSAARSAKISMILCMPERVSGGDAKFQGFCDRWNKWEGQVLSLACRGQRRRSLGFPDSVPQEHEGRDSVDAQTVGEAGFCPSTIVTDKLRSYGSAIRKLGLCAEHEQGLRKNNRAENSHQPVRRRERKMQRFKSPKSAQRFLAIHAAVYNLFNVQRHLNSRRTLRRFRTSAMAEWRATTTVA